MIILQMSQVKNVTFYTITIIAMDLELQEEVLFDELQEFTKSYFQSKDLRKKIWDKYWLSIDYWEWDECFELYHRKDWVIDMERDWYKLVEKMFYMIKNRIYLSNQLTTC